MSNALTQLMKSSFEFIWSLLRSVLAYPFMPDQRIFWLYMLSSSILALAIYDFRVVEGARNIKRPILMPPHGANYHQSGHHHWLPVCSTHLRVVYLINPLRVCTASFTAAGGATDIQ